jgi:hypothetical protein
MTRRSRTYLVQLTHRRPHEIPAQKWKQYVAAGLLIVIHERQRRARLRDSTVKAYWVDDDLVLFDNAVPISTNAAVIDRLWVLANGGEITLTNEEKRAVEKIRRDNGEAPTQPRCWDKPGTRWTIREYLAQQRTRLIQADLGKRRKTQIVVRRSLGAVAIGAQLPDEATT